METRRTEVLLTYNGASSEGGEESGWASAIGTWTELTYTDPAESEADEVQVSIFDRSNEWLDEKLPELGAKITATISTRSWGDAPGAGTLDCGELLLDDYSFSGWPTKGSISAVSCPADTNFRETERTKLWENVTIEEIGSEIAGRAGISLCWDAGAAPMIKSLEQTEKTDCSFFEELCEEYGYSVKIYTSKLVVYDREAYKAKDAVATITMQDVKTWDWKCTLAHTYTGGTYTYTIPKKNKKVTVEVGSAGRTLHKSGKADDSADAEKKIKAAVNTANHGAVTMNLSMMGRTDLMSCTCVNIEGFGKLDGKYYIDKATHTVSASGGYETSVEMSKVVEAAV